MLIIVHIGPAISQCIGLRVMGISLMKNGLHSHTCSAKDRNKLKKSISLKFYNKQMNTVHQESILLYSFFEIAGSIVLILPERERGGEDIIPTLA